MRTLTPSTETLVQPKPFLKWVGGKRQLLYEIRKHRPTEFSNYHEVCLGGGVHYFDLRASGYRGRAFLYDLNEELIRTYQAIQNSPAAVVKEVWGHALSHTQGYFLGLRSINPKDLNDAQVAGRMLYLNQACFNGLYRVNSKGQLNSPWGKRSSISINSTNIYAVSNALRDAILVQGDFAEVRSRASENDFCFIDPPYPSGFSAYTSIGFPDSDQSRLHRVCVELNRKNVMFMQSNSDCPLIRNLYKDFNIIPVRASRNINCKGDGRGKVGEVLITNY